MARRWRLITGALIALVALGAAVWVIGSRQYGGHRYYTDGTAIALPADDANVRYIVWDLPVPVGLPVNSAIDEYEPSLSADGTMLVFARGRPGETADLFVSHLLPGSAPERSSETQPDPNAAAAPAPDVPEALPSGMPTIAGRHWSEPEPLTAVNSAADDLGPSLSADGTTLVFCSDRDGGRGGYDLWMSRRGDDGQWSEPVNLGPKVNSAFNEYTPAISPLGEAILFASNRPATQEGATAPSGESWRATLRGKPAERTHDLYLARIGPDGPIGAWIAPNLNSPANDGSPSFSPAGDFVYFASDRDGGQGGFDLYRARIRSTGFEEPRNLGKPINTPANELDPSAAMGGFALVFSTDGPPSGEEPAATAPANDVAAQPRDYNLALAMSREVDLREVPPEPLVDWAALRPVLLSLLLWLAALAALILLLLFIRSKRFRTLSLLARCLLFSLLMHCIAMFLLTFWQVSQGFAGAIQHGKVQVALLMSDMHGSAAAQVRGPASGPSLFALDAVAGPNALQQAASTLSPAVGAAAPEVDQSVAALALRDDSQTISADSNADEAAPQRPTFSPDTLARVDQDEAAVTSVNTPESQAPRTAQENPLEAARIAAAPAMGDQSPTALPAAAPVIVSAAPELPTDRVVAGESLRTASALEQSTATDASPAPASAAPTSAAPTVETAEAVALAHGGVALPQARAVPQSASESAVALNAAAAASGVSAGRAETAPPTMAQGGATADVSPQAMSDTGRMAVRKSPGTIGGEAGIATDSPVGSAAGAVAAAPGAAMQVGAIEDAPTSLVAVALPAAGSAARGSSEPALEWSANGTSDAPAAAQSTIGPTAPTSDLAAGPGVSAATNASELNVNATAAGPAMVSSTQPDDSATGSAAGAAMLADAMARAMGRGGPVVDDGSALNLASAIGVPAGEATGRSGGGDEATVASLSPGAGANLGSVGQTRSSVTNAAAAQGNASTGTSITGALAGVSPAAGPAQTDAAMNAATDAPTGDAADGSGTLPPTAVVVGDADPNDSLGGGALAVAMPSGAGGAAAQRDGAGESGIAFAAPTAAGMHQGSSTVMGARMPSTANLSGGTSRAGTTNRMTMDAPAAGTNNGPATGTSPDAPTRIATAAPAPGLRGITPGDDGDLAMLDLAPTAPTGGGTQVAERPGSGSESSAPSIDRLGLAAAGSRRATAAIDGSSALGSALSGSPSSDRAGTAPALAISPGEVFTSPIQAAPDAAASPAQPAPLNMMASAALGDAALDETLKLDVKIPEVVPVDTYPQRAPEVRKELVEKMGGSPETERAVAKALEWLAAHQSEDGRWDADRFDDECGQCGKPATFDADNAVTGLALLCFLGADHTHVKDGPYRENVSRALTWLKGRQEATGDLRGGESMYSHGISTIALAEAMCMTRDESLREPVQRAVDFILRARNPSDNGWRYEPLQAGDTSVFGWQIMALTSARRAGLEIPAAVLHTAALWLDEVSTPDAPGQYAYQPGQPASPAMTAEAMFSRQLIGIPHDDPAQQASAEYIIRTLPRWRNDPNTYYWYYATLALYQHQGDTWDRWNMAMTRQLLEHQVGEGKAAGSWEPLDKWSRIGGRIYQTAVCTLSLEVYYRYLPMYGDVRQNLPAGVLQQP